MYFELFSKAKVIGLTTDIEIYLREELATGLELGEKLTIGFGDFVIENVPVVIDNSIKKKQIGNSEVFLSDIYIFDPKWLIEE